jgi:predicted PolB exonuclease-like 3'-5' exonuclease
MTQADTSNVLGPNVILVLDIETVQPEWSPPLDQPNAFAPLWSHQVVVIGCLLFSEDYHPLRIGCIGTPTTPENELLRFFSSFMSERTPTIVTFNGRGFDLPVMAIRAFRHNIQWAWYYANRGPRYRYGDAHLDLFDQLGDHGAARNVGGLDPVAKSIGLPGKHLTTGTGVDGFFKAGDMESISTYCLSDVAQTAVMLLRFQHLRGRITTPVYDRAVSEVMDCRIANQSVRELFQCHTA